MALQSVAFFHKIDESFEAFSACSAFCEKDRANNEGQGYMVGQGIVTAAIGNRRRGHLSIDYANYLEQSKEREEGSSCFVPCRLTKIPCRLLILGSWSHPAASSR